MTLDPAWSDKHRPAGSGYSLDEWASAREDGRYHVIELLSGEERGLLRIDTRKTPENTGWSITLGQAFDGCMLIGPGATPSHPNHVREKAVLVTDNGKKTHKFSYGIIEPVEMLNPWGRGASLTVIGSGLIDAPVLVKEGDATAAKERDMPSNYPRDR